MATTAADQRQGPGIDPMRHYAHYRHGKQPSGLRAPARDKPSYNRQVTGSSPVPPTEEAAVRGGGEVV